MPYGWCAYAALALHGDRAKGARVKKFRSPKKKVSPDFYTNQALGALRASYFFS